MAECTGRPTGMEYMKKLTSGRINHPPAALLLGFRWVDVGPGWAVCELKASKEHENLMGSLHGGIFASLADAAMGGAMGSTLLDDEAHTTLELKINFLKPVWNSDLTARGKIIKRGRTISLAEAEIYDQKGHLVAKSTGTFMALNGNKAEGRGMKER